jgi:hypothetical protein
MRRNLRGRKYPPLPGACQPHHVHFHTSRKAVRNNPVFGAFRLSFRLRRWRGRRELLLSYSESTAGVLPKTWSCKSGAQAGVCDRHGTNDKSDALTGLGLNTRQTASAAPAPAQKRNSAAATGPKPTGAKKKVVYWERWIACHVCEASSRDRTSDLPLTKRVLYH